MKTIIKAGLFIVFSVVMLKACQMEYVYSVVDSIPKEIRDRIISENPECAEISVLAAFWEEKYDSILTEIAGEQEYERELNGYLTNTRSKN